MYLQAAINSELAYKIESYLKYNSLSLDEFALNCDLSPEDVKRALNRKSIKISDVLRVCNEIGIGLNSLAYPPEESGYKQFVEKMAPIIASDNAQAVKITEFKNLQANLKIEDKKWDRYCLWAKYEVSEALEKSKKNKSSIYQDL